MFGFLIAFTSVLVSCHPQQENNQLPSSDIIVNPPEDQLSHPLENPSSTAEDCLKLGGEPAEVCSYLNDQVYPPGHKAPLQAPAPQKACVYSGCALKQTTPPPASDNEI